MTADERMMETFAFAMAHEDQEACAYCHDAFGSETVEIVIMPDGSQPELHPGCVDLFLREGAPMATVDRLHALGLYGPNDPPGPPESPDLSCCRECGCTDDNACIDEATCEPCYWVQPGLCSRCLRLIQETLPF